MLRGNNVYIRPLQERDAEDSLAFQKRNRDFFRAFSMSRKEGFYTIEGQNERIRDQEILRQQDELYYFGIFLNTTNQLIGSISLMDVVRADFQRASIRYFLDEEHNGKGYMTEAVELLLPFAFQTCHLHRVEAAVMPTSIGSIKVLEKAGFEKEGVAKKNIRINGVWEDHQMLAIVNPHEE